MFFGTDDFALRHLEVLVGREELVQRLEVTIPVTKVTGAGPGQRDTFDASGAQLGGQEPSSVSNLVRSAPWMDSALRLDKKFLDAGEVTHACVNGVWVGAGEYRCVGGVDGSWLGVVCVCV